MARPVTLPQPPQPILEVVGYVLRFFDGRLRQYDATLAKFSDEFKQDPVYVLSWGESVASAAAHRQVFRMIHDSIQRNIVTEPDKPEESHLTTLHGLCDYALGEVLRAARQGGSRSTSAFENRMQELIGVAWTEMYEFLRDTISSVEKERRDFGATRVTTEREATRA